MIGKTILDLNQHTSSYSKHLHLQKFARQYIVPLSPTTLTRDHLDMFLFVCLFVCHELFIHFELMLYRYFQSSMHAFLSCYFRHSFSSTYDPMPFNPFPTSTSLPLYNILSSLLPSLQPFPLPHDHILVTKKIVEAYSCL